MAAINAVLHGFDHSPIVRRDSICGGEDRWDEVQFDVMMENPPFSGQRGDAKRSLRIEKGDKYVLFLTLASLGLIEPEKTDHAEPEEILESVAAKEERILALVDEIKGLLQTEA